MKKLLTVAAGVTVLTVGACSNGASGSGKAAATASPAPRAGTVVQQADFTPRLQSAMKNARTMHLAMTASTDGAPGVSGEGDISTQGGVSEHLTMKAGAVPMELVLKGQAIYLKSSALPVGGKWIVARAGGADMLSRQMAPLFAQLKQMQPDQQVGNYAVADQKVVGQETVDGVRTTHYSSSPSAAQISRALSPSLASTLSRNDLTDIKVDLWVDGQNRPHKVVSSMKLKGKPVQTTLLLSKFGEPVNIAVPPAAQTTTAPQ